MALAAAAIAMMTGCGSSDGAAPSTATGSTSAAPSASSTATATAATPAASPSIIKGRLPKVVDCATLEVPKELRRTAAPPPKCGYESTTDALSVTVGLFLPRTPEQLRESEERQAGAALELSDAPAPGWSFGVRWPQDGAFVRTQYYLIASDAKVLECKTGTERGEAAVAELLAVCDGIRAALLDS